MGLTTATMQAAFGQMRVIFSGAVVTVRHGGNEYQGVRAALQSTADLSARGQLQTADGALRLSVADIQGADPKAGDPIDVRDVADKDFKTRSITAVRFDQLRATVRIEYGAQYG